MEMEDEGPLVEPPLMMVNLIGHCSICLRKAKRMTSTGDADPTSTSLAASGGGIVYQDKHNEEGYLEEEEGPLPEGRLPAELTSFRHIWAYLVGKGKVEEVARAKFVCSGGEEDDYGPGGMPLLVTELPPICEACGDKVTQLDRLHWELEGKIQEIKTVIKDAACGGGGRGGAPAWRRLGFAELLRNSQLEPGTIRGTFHFLEQLHETDSEWMDMNDPDSGTPDSPKSESQSRPGHDVSSCIIEPLMDDWKLKAEAVVSIAPVSLPIIFLEVEVEEEADQTRRGVKRRRGPVRKAKVPFLTQEDLAGYNWDHLLDRDIKKEVVEPMEANNEDIDSEMSMLPTPLLLDLKDDGASSDHDKECNPQDESVAEKDRDRDAPRLPKRGRKRGTRRLTLTPKRRKPKTTAQPPKSEQPGLLAEPKIAKQEKWNEAMCEICNATLQFPEMYEHMRTHVGDFVVKCPNPKCSAAFSNPRSMQQLHLKRKHYCRVAATNASHICETCGASYGSRGGAIALRAHLELHETATKNVSCPIQGCEERFTVRQSVYAHIYQKHLSPRTAQQCTLCKSFQDVMEMEAHLKDQHQIEDPIKCRQCSFVFQDWESLLHHLRQHYLEGVPCYICTTGYNFQNIAKLRRHYYKEHQIGKLIVCDLCGKEYTCMDALQQHIGRHHEGHGAGAKAKTFKCDLCEEGTTTAYTKEEKLVSHKIRVHGAEPFACDVCKATFNSRQDLNWHVRDRDPEDVKRGICTKPTQREWLCDAENCSVTHYSRASLNIHKRRDHGIVGPRSKLHYICEICSKEFYLARLLLNHRKNVHLRIRKKCMCEICGENFVSAYSLRRHKLIHENKRPHACHICGQTFRQKVSLDTHLKSHETLGDKFKPKGPIEGTKRFKREPKP